jgi:hypothetical protein
MGWQGPGRLPVQQVPDRLVTRRELAVEMRVGARTVDRLRGLLERSAPVVDLDRKRRGA